MSDKKTKRETAHGAVSERFMRHHYGASGFVKKEELMKNSEEMDMEQLKREKAIVMRNRDVPQHISRETFLDIEEAVIRYLKHKLHGKLLTHEQGTEFTKTLAEEIEFKAEIAVSVGNCKSRAVDNGVVSQCLLRHAHKGKCVWGVAAEAKMEVAGGELLADAVARIESSKGESK
jgi:hypothetical protein